MDKFGNKRSSHMENITYQNKLLKVQYKETKKGKWRQKCERVRGQIYNEMISYTFSQDSQKERKWVVKVISEETISDDFSGIMTQSTDLKGLRNPSRIFKITFWHIIVKLQKMQDNKKFLKVPKVGGHVLILKK